MLKAVIQYDVSCFTLSLVGELLDHSQFRNNLFPTVNPLTAIVEGTVQMLITGDAKNTAFLQLLCQWNDAKVKETNLTLGPKISWVFLRLPIFVSCKHFFKELLIPFPMHMPVLHCVCNV